MIVIATNNGIKYLPGLLESIDTFGSGDHKVLVADTGSTCPESVAYLEELRAGKGPIEVSVTQTPFRGYDTGAYLHAFREHPADTYLFMQDSTAIKHPEWLSAFESRLTYNVGCVPWLTFPMQWDNQDQVDWVQKRYQTSQWPPFGIFGPIFLTTHAALESLEARKYLDIVPSNKLEQQAMERGWATAFELSGWSVRPIETEFDEDRLFNDMYTHLTKRFAVRS